MSGVKGKKRESDFSKETGFFEGKVVAINPDKERLEKLLNTTLEKDLEYLSEDENGVKKLSVVVWLQNVKTNKLKSVRFFLKDVERKNTIKEGDVGKKPKKQYINNVGMTTWAESESLIPDWFKEKGYRVAHEGEEELYAFITSWLSDLDLRDAEAALSFDWSKLMRGNLKDITEQIGGEYETTVVVLNTVRVVDGDEGQKEYEQVYNRKFLPGYTMKQIVNKKIDAAFVAQASAKDIKKRSRLEKFVLEVTDRQYGIRDFYTLGELEEYNPSKNPVAGDKALADDDTEY